MQAIRAPVARPGSAVLVPARPRAPRPKRVVDELEDVPHAVIRESLLVAAQRLHVVRVRERIQRSIALVALNVPAVAAMLAAVRLRQAIQGVVFVFRRWI